MSLACSRGLDVLVRGEVVRDEHDPARISHLADARGLEFQDRQRRGDVVAQGDVHVRVNELARA